MVFVFVFVFSNGCSSFQVLKALGITIVSALGHLNETIAMPLGFQHV
jgi:hypothetical protein